LTFVLEPNYCQITDPWKLTPHSLRGLVDGLETGATRLASTWRTRRGQAAEDEEEVVEETTTDHVLEAVVSQLS